MRMRNFLHSSILSQRAEAETYSYYSPTWKWADLYCASPIPEACWDVYTKLGGILQRFFRALDPDADGNEQEMKLIKDAIDNIKIFICGLGNWTTMPSSEWNPHMTHGRTKSRS